MKFTLKPGETIETLTPDELEGLLDRVAERFSQPLDERVLNPTSVILSAAGAGTLIAYEVPPGYDLRLDAIVLNAAGVTPAAPYTAAGAYVAVFSDESASPGSLIDFSSTTTIFPSRFSWSSNEAPIVRSGQVVLVQVVNGPANGNVTARLQGVLERSRTPLER